MADLFGTSIAQGGPGRRPHRPLRIGEWVADPEVNALRRGARTVRIEPKAMDVLMLLAERVGCVVSREELFAAVWPHVVVGDEALTQAINKLRKALGDDSRSPSYIDTVSKRGYRLIASVERSDDGPVRGSAQEADAARKSAERTHDAAPRAGPAGRERRWSPAVLAGLALAAVFAGFALVHALPRVPAAQSIEAEDGRATGWVGVAVSPFESLGSDRDQAYFARGISDDLIIGLSRLSGLRVIRESGEASDAVRARYRISGSVQRDSGTLRVSVHLVDAPTGEELWSRRFERPVGDLFAVQDEMAGRLVELLPAKLSEVERERLAKRYTQSLEAYDDFLRGQALFLMRSPAQNDEARAFYRKAIELDPKFARAYAGVAMTYAMDYRLGEAPDRSPALDRATEFAESARSIDPDLPEVYWALGFVETQNRRYAEAIESLEKAINLDPSFADAYALLGGILTYEGQPEKSIAPLRTAMRLNPGGGYLYLLLLGRAYLFVGDADLALINLRAAAMRNPADVETRVYLAAALAASGDHQAAKWEGVEIRALAPGFSLPHWLDTYPMTSAPQRQRLSALLADTGL